MISVILFLAATSVAPGNLSPQEDLAPYELPQRTTVRGALSLNEVETALLVSGSKLEPCFKSVMEPFGEQAFSVTVETSFEVGADGSVQNPSLRVHPALSASAQDCIRLALSEVTFPASRAGTTAVTHQIVWSTQDVAPCIRRRRGQIAPVKLAYLTQPLLVEARHQPAYPPDAKRRGITGTVVLQLVVTREGCVAAAKVKESLAEDLDQAALASAKLTRFSPARVNGVPVDTVWVYRFNFELDMMDAPSDSFWDDQGTGIPGYNGCSSCCGCVPRVTQ